MGFALSDWVNHVTNDSSEALEWKGFYFTQFTHWRITVMWNSQELHDISFGWENNSEAFSTRPNLPMQLILEKSSVVTQKVIIEISHRQIFQIEFEALTRRVITATIWGEWDLQDVAVTAQASKEILSCWLDQHIALRSSAIASTRLIQRITRSKEACVKEVYSRNKT